MSKNQKAIYKYVGILYKTGETVILIYFTIL